MTQESDPASAEAEPPKTARRSGPLPRSKKARPRSVASWLVIGVPAVAVVAALVVSRGNEAAPGAPSSLPSVRASELARPPAKRRDAPLTGIAKEVIQAASYTYVLVATEDEGDQWAAVNRSEIAKGDPVGVDGAILMERFESKALSRTFDRIWFGVLLTSGIEEGEPPPAPAPPAAALTGRASATATGSAASGAGSAAPLDATALLSPADVLARAKELSGKKIRVAGEVTKVNEAILDRNWIHISGGAKDGSRNDLLVTSKALVKVGEVVTLTGTVGLDKDFGGGYRYDVVVEDGELTRERL